MNHKNNKIIYFFLKNPLLQNIISETINSINQFSDLFDFALWNNTDLSLIEADIIITDNLSYEFLLKSNFTKSINKIYILNELHNLDNNNSKFEIINIELPFNLNNLVNQIINDSTQILNQKKTEYNFLNFNYSNANRKIFNEVSSLRLTEKENDIFYYLINSKNKHLSKENLLKNIWNYGDGIDTHTVETHIYVLRKKIEQELGIKNIIIYDESGYMLNKELL